MILTIIAFIIILGILIYVHELGHFLAARWSGVEVEEFAFGFPPTIWRKKYKGTDYLINAIPLGGYVKMLGEDSKVNDPKSFSSQKARKRLFIVVAGVIMNFLLAYVLFVVGYLVGTTPVAIDPSTLGGQHESLVVVASVVDGSPAQAAGLQEGDFINGFESAEALSEYTRANKGGTISLDVTRNGETEEITVDLSEDSETPLGVGLGGSGVQVRLNFWQALVAACREVVGFIVLAFQFLWGLIVSIFTTGSLGEQAEGIAGPVGIYTITGQAVKLGFIYIVQWIAILSLNLGLVNILPFPALDGGRAVFILLEGVTRRKVVKEEIEGIIHTIGFILLILLIIAITYKEVYYMVVR